MLDEHSGKSFPKPAFHTSSRFCFGFENSDISFSFQPIMNQTSLVSRLRSPFVQRGKGRGFTHSPYLSCCSCWGLVAHLPGLCPPATMNAGRTRLELLIDPMSLPMLLRADWFCWRTVFGISNRRTYGRIVLFVATRKNELPKSSNNTTARYRPAYLLLKSGGPPLGIDAAMKKTGLLHPLTLLL